MPTATSGPHLTHPKYRPDIDGLRAIAVLSVVLFHAFPRWLPGGFIGVDIFFIISGYLISTIIYGSLERQAFSFSEFYARRIKRIFPALLLVLISCYAFGWFTLFADEFQQLGKHIAGGSAFISNFILWDESGYFDTTAEIKPLLHLWSLGIEEQFYIVWPLILWAAWKIRLNILTLTVICLSASFLLNIINIQLDPSATFYLPQTRAWELLAGSVMAYMTTHHGTQTRSSIERFINIIVMRPGTQCSSLALRNVQTVTGLALLCAGFAFVSSVGFPGWQALIPCAGAILIISAGPQAWLNRNILANKLLVSIGLISFPLYLWHWPLLSFARIIESETPSREIRIAAVAISIVLASATYLLIEKPLRRNNSKFKTAILIVLMAIVGVTGYITYKYSGLPNRATVKSAEAINSQFVGPIWKYAKNDICLNKYQFKEAESYGWWFCMSNDDKTPTVLLLGNSYANQIYPGFSQNSKLRSNSILSIGACDPAIDHEAGSAVGSNVSPCSGERAVHQKELINNIIENSKSIKYVIIDGLNPSPNQEYIDNLRTRIDFAEKHNSQVIVFTPHLRVNYDIKGCFSRPLSHPKKDCVISLTDKEITDQAFNRLITSIKTTNPNVLFYDQNNLFCNSSKCSMIRDGMPLFRDEYHHISEFGSNETAKLFIEWAKANAPGILN